MNAILIALLVTTAPDAPLVVPRPAIAIVEGQPAPFSGYLMDEVKGLEQTRRIASCEGERDKLKDGHISALVVVLFVAGAFVLGGTAGFAIARAAK